jgi:hypothetical protein
VIDPSPSPFSQNTLSFFVPQILCVILSNAFTLVNFQKFRSQVSFFVSQSRKFLEFYFVGCCTTHFSPVRNTLPITVVLCLISLLPSPSQIRCLVPTFITNGSPPSRKWRQSSSISAAPSRSTNIWPPVFHRSDLASSLLIYGRPTSIWPSPTH